MKNVIAEMEEIGDGGDSDNEGELAEELDDAAKESMMESRVHMDDKEAIEVSDQNVMNLSSSESEKWKNNLGKMSLHTVMTWFLMRKVLSRASLQCFMKLITLGIGPNSSLDLSLNWGKTAVASIRVTSSH